MGAGVTRGSAPKKPTAGAAIVVPTLPGHTEPPGDLMELSQRKAEFSVAYVHAIASLAGYTVGQYRIDDDGVDISIASKGTHGTYRSPRLEAQLKCTADPIFQDGRVRYPLKKHNYDKLRGEYGVPRILIVLQVPKETDLWLSHFDMGIIWRNRAYWTSLKDCPESDRKSKVLLDIPGENIFDVPTLHSLMNLAARREL